jgi:hypothetical protein
MWHLRSIFFTIGVLYIAFSATQETTLLLSAANADTTSASISLNPLIKDQQDQHPRYVFDVVIHDPTEMDRLLNRIELLADSITTNEDDPNLALVLHGPEIAFFTRKNYSKYMNMVDRAAALDKKGIIDVKVCDTMMRALQLEKDELPEFVDHVPYGPAEIERLVRKGFINM